MSGHETTLDPASDDGDTRPTAPQGTADPAGEALSPGQIIARRYRVERVLGRGGMGDVYLATHVDLKRPVALKLLHAQYAEDAEMIERFRREAMCGARLDSDNVVRVHDVERLADGRLMVVTEYADGDTLRARLKRDRTLDPKDAVAVAQGICAGLEAAHRAGIIHRDLKPDNVVFAGGRPKIIDFGIARLAEGSTQLTAAGGVMGTPRYMAPEQIRGEKVEPPADLYALGVILYEMLSGTTPHASADLQGLIYRKLNEPPEPLDTRVKRLDPRLYRLVDRLLSRAPTERFRSAAEVSAVLAGLAGGPAAEAGGRTGSAPGQRLLAIGAACAVLAGVGIGTWLWGRGASAPEIAPIQATVADGAAGDGTSSAPNAAVEAPAQAVAPGALGIPAAVAPAVTPEAPLAPPAAVPAPAPVRALPGPPTEVEVASTPVAADVYLSGARIGRTPLRLPLAAGDGSLALELRASGYATRRVSVPLTVIRSSGLRRLEYELKPARTDREAVD